MSERITKITKTERTSNFVVRDKQYYFNTLDIEADLLRKAADIAERMMAAFMRENKVEVSLNVDDIAHKIMSKLDDKLQSYVFKNQNVGLPTSSSVNHFTLDDKPVILKTDKIEVKGKIGNTIKSKDNISDNLDALENLEI